MVKRLINQAFDGIHLVLDYVEALLVWLAVDRRFVDRKTAELRLTVCNGCPLNVGHVCQACGCRVGQKSWWNRFSSKVYFPSEHCPEGKW